MTKNAIGMVLMAAAVTASGCLQKETTHTLYLAPDGGVRWMAIEQNVRSDEKDPAARRAEEDAYLASATAGTHGVARGLAALDPLARRTRILRSERPFIVVTEAQFPSIEDLFQRMLADLRVPGSATITRADGRSTLRIHIDVSAAAADDSDEPSPVTELLEDLASFRIVLTGGRFFSASGFTLSDDGATAAPLEIVDGGVVELALTWDAARESNP